MRHNLLKLILLGIAITFFAAGCRDLLTNHSLNMDGVMHGEKLDKGANNCSSCHGINLEGNGPLPSCYGCHDRLWSSDDHITDRGGVKHLFALDSSASCGKCHGGPDLKGKRSRPSCYQCHDDNWSGFTDHSLEINGYFHKPDMTNAMTDCIDCHGADMDGGTTGVSCYQCHFNKWDPSKWIDHTVVINNARHATGHYDPEANCVDCHGSDLKGTKDAPSCYSCHWGVWAGAMIPHTDYEHGIPHARGMDTPIASGCGNCHGADLRGANGIDSCYKCHGNEWDDDDHDDD
ncbi:MAG: hypothetical protein OEY59_02010 [Deltaproteobacteria bacterium]|nr:hypothetical protein [Deltaproteobacteria bacterium]